MVKVIAFLLIMGALQCFLPALVVSEPSGCIQPPSLDFQKAERTASHQFLKHACWPNARTMKVKRYTGSVDSEITDIRKMIDRVMKRDSQPTGSALKSKVVPLTELYDGNDYLLLDYRNASGYRIQVQDSQGFFLLVTAPSGAVKNLSEVKSFVLETGASVLAPPPEYLARPIIETSSQDIGESRFGYMQYGPREGIVPEDWYTQVSWWSDGRQVLFVIAKTEKAEYDRQRTTSRLQMSPLPPRVFASRKDPCK